MGGFPGGSDGKESACSEGDLGSIPGSGRSPGEGNGNPLQYSCLENPRGFSKDRRPWQVTVHRVAKSQTRLSDYHSLTQTVYIKKKPDAKNLQSQYTTTTITSTELRRTH